MNCYACGQPAWQRCARCDRPYCSSHGRVRCNRCRAPEHAVPSSLFYRSVLALSFLSLALTGWHAAEWPQLVEPPPPPEGLLARAAEVVTMTPAPTEASTATATASPEPAVTAQPAATPTPEQRRHTVQQGDTL